MIETERRADASDILERLSAIEAKLDTLMREFTDHKKDIHGAFLKDDDGEPDFHGHKYDHKDRKEAEETINEHKKKVIGGLLGAFIIASITFAAQATWEYVKRGLMK